MDLSNIDFVQYHLSVLNGTVMVSDYEKFFSKPLSDILTYKDDDLMLAMELFGPYFAKRGFERNDVKYNICDLLCNQLCVVGFTGDMSDLSLLFSNTDCCDRLEYNVDMIDGFILFSLTNMYEQDYYVTYNLDVSTDSNINRTMVYVLKNYLFYYIDDCRSDYPPYSIEIGKIVHDTDGYYLDDLLMFYLKDATYSHTNSCFYEKMRDNAIGMFLWIMGDDRINERELLIYVGFGAPRMDNINRLVVTNEYDITYRQLLAPTMALLQNGKDV